MKTIILTSHCIRVCFWSLGILGLMGLISCKEDPQEPPPPPDPRDELTGIFEMTKLENGEVYFMKVEKMGTLCNWCDSLRYTNYGDMFHFENLRYPNVLPNYLDIGILSPITDKYGRRWLLSGDGSPYAPYNYNMIINDSLTIRFKISNVQYYLEDGVPRVFDSVITHVGRRVAQVE